MIEALCFADYSEFANFKMAFSRKICDILSKMPPIILLCVIMLVVSCMKGICINIEKFHLGQCGIYPLFIHSNQTGYWQLFI
jgi:hypothetical protein